MRKIIHCDCDCFFAAIEMRDDPALRDRPLAVGGAPDRRGVISTCNYPARAYGVRSALPTAVAMRLCPDLLVLPHRMDAYKTAAEQIREIFADYTDLIEPLSLDEAYLDVTDSDTCRGSATLMAEDIRQRVQKEVGISISAGVAPNKFLAKVGSDWNKPNGLCVITPEQVDGFVSQLPVSRISGVGRVTTAKLERLGVHRCADLQRLSLLELRESFGSFGQRLYSFSRGQDDRPVVTERRRKSLSVEHTYVEDLSGVESCLQQLPGLYQQFLQRLERLGEGYQPCKQYVKVKFANFESTTIESSLRGKPRLALFRKLFEEAYQRLSMPVRLMGLGVRFSEQHSGQLLQLPLFSD
jgi:DNA polymerase-4